MQQSGTIGAVKSGMAPARLVIEIFGEEGAAAIAGVKIDAVRKWKRKRSTGGLGGLVPARHQAAFLRAADVLGKALSADQLIGDAY